MRLMYQVPKLRVVTSDLFGFYPELIEVGVRMRWQDVTAIVEGARSSEEHDDVMHS